MEDVLQYLESKGLSPKRASANEVHVPCFYCGESDSKRGRLYINVDPNAEIPGLHTCFLCGERGSLAKIKRHFGDQPTPQEDQARSLGHVFTAAAEYYHEQLLVNPTAMEYLQVERGLTEETIKKFKLGWADGRLKRELTVQKASLNELERSRLYIGGHDFFFNCITIPYFVAGNVVTIRGKEIGGKYKGLPASKARLYNSDDTWNAEEIIICEGELDALVAHQLGFKAVGVPGANNWQDTWDYSFKSARRVYLAFDNDTPGRKGADQIKQRLGAKAHISIIPPIDSDPEDKNDLTDWIVAQNHDAADLRRHLESSLTRIICSVDEAFSEWRQLQGQQGLKFGIEMLDLMIRPGLLPAQLLVILAKTNAGKALRVDQPVLTPSGWRKIGELEVGDEVIGSNGKPTRVTGVFPQGIRPLYEVKFSDGGTVVCDGDHLWNYRTKNDTFNDKPWRTAPLKEIQYKRPSDGQRDAFIPVFRPNWDESSDKTLPIDPYTLGVLLGDGCFRRGTPSFSTVDQEILDALVLPDGMRIRKSPGDNVDYEFQAGTNPRNPLKSLLLELGLWQKKSEHKFIPDPYMHAPAVDRLALLQGLMDTDGTANELGSCEFGSTSRLLVEQVAELVSSLGGVTGWFGKRIRTKKTTHQDFYRTTVTMPVNPFRLKRKEWKRAKNIARAIDSVTRVEDGEAVCISVDAADELFVTRDYLVTHNTVSLLNMFQLMSQQKPDLKVLFFSLEQTRGDWFERARRIYGFHHRDMAPPLPTSTAMEEFRNKLGVATLDYWRPKLYIADKNRVSSDEFRIALDEFIDATGSKPDLVAVDYLGYLAAAAHGKDRYEKTSNAVMDLKGVAKDYLIPIIAPHQVNRTAEFGSEPDVDAARDSGAIEETADFIFSLWSSDNQKGKGMEERTGQINFRIGKSRHGGKGGLIKLQFGMLSLAMLPIEDPSCRLLRDEIEYQVNMDTWDTALYRHRTGDRKRKISQDVF